MLSANEIAELHDSLTREWHLRPPAPEAELSSATGVWKTVVARQHLANFELWHTEDEARRPTASDADLATVKRSIDRTNQRRNDLTEALDTALLGWLEKRHLPNPQAELNSESVGLIIDRLSILALRIYHTQEEVHRAEASAEHVERNRQRLNTLLEQRADLTQCLDRLWEQTLLGSRRFRIYRQLKMYNDPSLNPAIYQKSAPSDRE